MLLPTTLGTIEGFVLLKFHIYVLDLRVHAATLPRWAPGGARRGERRHMRDVNEPERARANYEHIGCPGFPSGSSRSAEADEATQRGV